MSAISSTVATILTSFFEKKKRESKTLSIRSLARRFDLSPSFIHQVLKGKKVASPELYDNLCRFLDIDVEKRDYIINQCLKAKGLLAPNAKRLTTFELDSVVKENSWKPISRDSFELLKEWHYIPVAEATRLAAYDGTAKFIANALGIDLALAEDALAKLATAGILTEKNGRLVKAETYTDFSSQHGKEEIRQFHIENMKRAIRALGEKLSAEEVEARLVTSLTFGCREDDVPLIKQKLAGFMQSLSEEFSSRPADRIYQFAVQFLPVDEKKS